MISVILLILKIIGIILLSILGLVLLIMLLVLWVPIRYKGQLKYDQDLQGEFSVSWLLHCISFRGIFDGKDLKFKIRALWGIEIGKNDEALQDTKDSFEEVVPQSEMEIPVNQEPAPLQTVNEKENPIEFGSEESDRFSQTSKETESVREAFQEVDFKLGSEHRTTDFFNDPAWEQEDLIPQTPVALNLDGEEIVRTKDSEDSNETFSKQEAEATDKAFADQEAENEDETFADQENEPEDATFTDREEKSSQEAGNILDLIMEKLSSWLHSVQNLKIRSFLQSAYEKIFGPLKKFADASSEKYNQIFSLIHDQHIKNAIGYGLKMIKKLLRHILPKKAFGYLEYGFEDPSLTGRICGGISATAPIHRNFIDFRPNFQEAGFKADAGFMGRIYTGYLLLLALRVVLNKDVRYTYKRFK